MAKTDLHVVYADQFSNHPEGHALYTKVSASHMKPGVCGFFSESGQWTPVQDIADTRADFLAAQGWEPPRQPITTIDDGGIEWPIRLSDSVKEIKVTADTMASVPNAPVAGGFKMSFSTKRGAGAVLMTAGEVTCHRLERDILAYRWLVEPQNMQKLLLDWEEISKQKRTLWMVTGTYTAASCAISVLQSSESSASIGMDVHVADVAQAKPSFEWWNQKSDKTWIKYKDDSGVVLFMSGIALRTSFFRRTELHAEFKRRKQDLFRDASTANLQYPLEHEKTSEDPLVAVVVPEYHGQKSEELETELDKTFAGSNSEDEVSSEEEDDH